MRWQGAQLSSLVEAATFFRPPFFLFGEIGWHFVLF